jgi:UDP-N-acetylmuramoylalanine--D-glutamate ligase
MEFKGLRATIIGLAREGSALARFLAERGAEVTVTDIKREEELRERMVPLAHLPIRFVLGSHPIDLLDETDILFVSPGVPLEIPIVQEARKRGIPVSGESRLFCELCPATIIGITGSSGKTTTTAVTGEMLKEAGIPTWVGGNIGRPLIESLEKIQPQDRVVMELSSFQLKLFGPDFGLKPLSPPVAAILNITPNHLDRHPSMEDYIAAKKNIFLHQGENGVAVFGYDNAISRSLAAEAKGKVWFFSLGELPEGAFLRNDRLYLKMDETELEICRTDEIKMLGRHNVANLLAASLLAYIGGADIEAIRNVAINFKGVEHRLEFVREVRGVKYYNDSIATSPERVVAALNSFDEPIVLLAGGKDKNLPWEEMAALTVKKVRHIVIFGEAAPKIERAVREARSRLGASTPEISLCSTLEEAVAEASRVARPGDIVLLSPGGTSFDAFRDYAHRGERFKELVARL